MIPFFLKAKHWQLFLLGFGILMIAEVFFMILIFTQALSHEKTNPDYLVYYFMLLPLFMLLLVSIQFGWYWSIAIGLQAKIPSNIIMPVKRIKTLILLPYIFTFIFLLFFLYLVKQLMISSDTNYENLILYSLFIIVPMHLISMASIFHTYYFTAKTIKTVELQREVTFNDFVGEFFLVWFFPIGIWILQPRINKLA